MKTARLSDRFERRARATLDRLRAWREGRSGAGSWPEPPGKALLEGLGATYRWARQAMGAAYLSGRHEAFEAWHRALHHHGLQFRLLAATWPEELEGRREVLTRLEELLAQDHALRVFTGPPPPGNPGNPPGMIDQRHQALRALARPLGRRLFADPPVSFCRRLQRCLPVSLPAQGDETREETRTDRTKTDRTDGVRPPAGQALWAAAS